MKDRKAIVLAVYFNDGSVEVYSNNHYHWDLNDDAVVQIYNDNERYIIPWFSIKLIKILFNGE